MNMMIMQKGILKCVSVLFVLILTSSFYFPVITVGMSGTNSKMLLAVVGLCIYLTQLACKRTGAFNKDTFILSIWAATVSLIAIVSMIYNNTFDNIYSSYIISMWVWIGAAYAVVKAIQWVHGYTSVRLVGTYLMGVCVLQCLLALLIDGIPEVKQVIDTYFLQGAEFMERTNRLYGIGAALDVSGIRFSCVLVIIAVILATLSETESRKYTFFYLMAFIWISIVGNMIARTTTVGVFLGMTYLIYKTKLYTLHIKVNEHIRLWMYFGILLMIAAFVSVYLYQVDLKFRHDFRFAFEGFFSLAEEGKWYVSSNNTLKFMYVFPDNIKTWIIGDGYLSNPADVDPYFTGKIIKGFYMGTDVGYLRFIFYFGLIGLIVFTGLFHKASQICQNRFPNQKDMFILLLIVNYIVWFKVSTDVFSTFAILLMIDKEKTQKTNNEYES